MKIDKVADFDEKAFVKAFHQNGFVVVSGLVSKDECESILSVVKQHLQSALAPVEFEVDVQYPGAPYDIDDPGGRTIRRLLHAYSRDEVFRNWAKDARVRNRLEQLFESKEVQVSQSHHNCVMTKGAGFSSSTSWHQDNRYWSFDEENLVSVWLAMGEEREENGCLWVIPASHKFNLPSGRYDSVSFLRTDIIGNQDLIASATKVELNQGDVLFFHSKLLHAAGRNKSDKTKKSLVFTYHEASNHAIENTRSSRFPSISL